MRPSQIRQFRCWMSIWAKVGALFVVTMAFLSIAATAYKEAVAARAKSQTVLNDAVRQGQIRAWPIQPQKLTTSVEIGNSASSSASGSVIIIAPPTTSPPPPVVPLTLALARGSDGAKFLTSPCAVGQSCYLEASLDLHTWTRISTNTAIGPLVIFGITDDPAHGRVFYRLSGDPPPSNPTTPPVPPKEGTNPGPIFVSPTTGKKIRPNGAVSSVVTNSVNPDVTNH